MLPLRLRRVLCRGRGEPNDERVGQHRRPAPAHYRIGGDRSRDLRRLSRQPARRNWGTCARPRRRPQVPMHRRRLGQSANNQRCQRAAQSQAAGALIGAVMMAATLAALWLTDLIPAREGTASHTLASNTSAPAPPLATPPPIRRNVRRQAVRQVRRRRLCRRKQVRSRPISVRGSTRSSMRSRHGVPNRRSATGSTGWKSKRNRSATGRDPQRRVDEIAASEPGGAKQADKAPGAAEGRKAQEKPPAWKSNPATSTRWRAGSGRWRAR